MNKCGFSLKSALEVSKQVHFESPDKPGSVLDIFKNYSFSKGHILNLVRRCPAVLLSKPHETLLPKLEFFQFKGFSSPVVVKIILSYPWILRCSLENQLVPAFNFFENLLQSDAMAIKAIKCYPYILDAKIENLASIIDVLRDEGVPKKYIILLVFYQPIFLRVFYQPRRLRLNPENLKKLVQELTLLGFHPSKSYFVAAIRVLTSMRISTWEKKLDVCRKWCLSQEEILVSFVKRPLFMALSEKVMTLMDLFVNKMGWEASYLAKNPFISSFSVEKRLIPMALILQFLVSKRMIEKSFRSTSFFDTPENKFWRMFIDHHAESTQILKFYEERLNLSSVTNSSSF